MLGGGTSSPDGIGVAGAGVVAVRNRAAISWGFSGQCPADCSTILINTDTGGVVSAYLGRLEFNTFDCTGSRLIILDIGLVDSVSGALVAAGVGVAGNRADFVCP